MSAESDSPLYHHASSAPEVSVVIPCFLSAKYIAEALDSLRAQTFRNFEVIIVNDACPETSQLEIALAPYRDEIVYLRHEVNKGPSSARNTGIEAARAPLIAMLDSDDIWDSRYLEVQTNFLASHPEIDVVYPNAEFFGDSPWAGKSYMEMIPSKGEVTFRSLLLRECNVFTGVTVRREALMKVGMYDPQLRRAEDFDLWLRLAKNGSKFKYHDLRLVRYRLSHDSLSDDKLNLQVASLEVYTKLSLAPDLTEEQRELTARLIRIQQATIDLISGKRALYSRNRKEAVLRLSNANHVFRDKKLACTLLLLHIWPELFYRYIHFRYTTEYDYLH